MSLSMRSRNIGQEEPLEDRNPSLTGGRFFVFSVRLSESTNGGKGWKKKRKNIAARGLRPAVLFMTRDGETGRGKFRKACPLNKSPKIGDARVAGWGKKSSLASMNPSAARSCPKAPSRNANGPRRIRRLVYAPAATATLFAYPPCIPWASAAYPAAPPRPRRFGTIWIGSSGYYRAPCEASVSGHPSGFPVGRRQTGN